MLFRSITSAHEEYALKGFEFNVTDYILKPFSFDRCRKSIEKAIFNINLTNKQLGRNSEKEQYLSVKSEYKTEMIPLDSIVFIEGMKDYIRIHTIDKKIMTLKSMTAIEKELP